jgi:hypothetical protein
MEMFDLLDKAENDYFQKKNQSNWQALPTFWKPQKTFLTPKNPFYYPKIPFVTPKNQQTAKKINPFPHWGEQS